MCTSTVTGTTWREPECSGSGPWQGTTYSLTSVRGPETAYSLPPDELTPPDEVTLSAEPRRGREDSVSISDARD